jgi:hypothetical protein
MTMPLTGGAAGKTLSVHAQGFSFLDAGAKVSVTLRGAAGRSSRASAPVPRIRSSRRWSCRPGRGVTYQLTFDIDIDIDRGAGAEGTGNLTIAAIDIGIN